MSPSLSLLKPTGRTDLSLGSFKWHISALQRLSHSSLFGKCSTWLQPPEAGSNFLFKVSVFMVVTTPVMNSFLTIKPNQMSHYADFSFLWKNVYEDQKVEAGLLYYYLPYIFLKQKETRSCRIWSHFFNWLVTLHESMREHGGKSICIVGGNREMTGSTILILYIPV